MTILYLSVPPAQQAQINAAWRRDRVVVACWCGYRAVGVSERAVEEALAIHRGWHLDASEGVP